MSEPTKPQLVIPGCETIIRSNEDVSTEKFLSIAFWLASAYPNGKVTFSLSIEADFSGQEG